MVRRISFSVVALLLVVSCAQTPLGRAYQSAGVLVTANQQAQAECERSKSQGRILATTEPDPVKAEQLRANGIPPFTKTVCAELAAAYKIASQAASSALDLTSKGAPTAPAITAHAILFVYKVADALQQAGVAPAKSVRDFMDEINRLLLRPTEVN